MKQNIVRDKAFDFAVRIVNLRKYLITEKQERSLSLQILRSGTSIGANLEEAIGAQTKKDFVAKLSVAYKETRETLYWLKLLYRTGYIQEEHYNSLRSDCSEIEKLLSSSLLTAKNYSNNKEIN